MAREDSHKLTMSLSFDLNLIFALLVLRVMLRLVAYVHWEV